MSFIETQFSHFEKKPHLSKSNAQSRTYRYKGNELQAAFNEAILTKLYELKELIKVGSVTRSRNLVKDVIKDVEKRIKCIKIADRSPGGWETVKEYLSDDLASDSADERRIRKAEKRALQKRKPSSTQSSRTVSIPPMFASASRPSLDPPPTDKTGRPDRPSKRTSSTASTFTNQRCFRCGRYGHYRKDCYARSRPSEDLPS